VSAVRLGVFGGTFDPPHFGHLIVAHDAAEALALDRVLLVLSARPPHRAAAALTPAELRYDMLAAAAAGDPLLEPSDLELRRPGPSYTDAAARERRARFKLALVGLNGGFELMPSQLSGGMRKRAALARALALDPELLYLDEPGSGLDPGNTARLDDLVLHLRQHLGSTVVMVTHEISSVFSVADRALFLDEQSRTMTAIGPPSQLLASGPPEVRAFLGGKGVD
jgi:cytidyltransferase-like protein